MTVTELQETLAELDPTSEIFFTRNDDLPYVYLVGRLPDGTKALSEMPTAVLKPKEKQ